MNESLNALHEWIQAGMEQRGKNASGSTMRSVTISTSEGPTFVDGTLSADHQWRYVGSGRGPGGLPPIQNIQDWIDSKGLDISAWGVAKKIAQSGSADYRQKNSNVFLDAIEAWEAHDLKDMDEALGKDLEDKVVELSVTQLRNGR